MSSRHRRKRDDAENWARMEAWLENVYKTAFVTVLLHHPAKDEIPTKYLAEMCHVWYDKIRGTGDNTMTEKERAYKDHLKTAHDREFDASCAPLLCDDCERLWGVWCMELLDKYKETT